MPPDAHSHKAGTWSAAPGPQACQPHSIVFPMGRQPASLNSPFVLGGITKQWPSHWCGTRAATHPPGLWPKQVDRREGPVRDGWRKMREGGRGERRLHLSPHSTTPWVSHCSICSQERGRHACKPRLTGGGGTERRGLGEVKLSGGGFLNCQISCII